jgi:hypothetical protein
MMIRSTLTIDRSIALSLSLSLSLSVSLAGLSGSIDSTEVLDALLEWGICQALPDCTDDGSDDAVRSTEPVLLFRALRPACLIFTLPTLESERIESVVEHWSRLVANTADEQVLERDSWASGSRSNNNALAMAAEFRRSMLTAPSSPPPASQHLIQRTISFIGRQQYQPPPPAPPPPPPPPVQTNSNALRLSLPPHQLAKISAIAYGVSHKQFDCLQFALCSYWLEHYTLYSNGFLVRDDTKSVIGMVVLRTDRTMRVALMSANRCNAGQFFALIVSKAFSSTIDLTRLPTYTPQQVEIVRTPPWSWIQGRQFLTDEPQHWYTINGDSLDKLQLVRHTHTHTHTHHAPSLSICLCLGEPCF